MEDRLANGINVNINTVAEMIDFAEFVGMDAKAYLGEVNLDDAKESSYK